MNDKLVKRRFKFLRNSENLKDKSDDEIWEMARNSAEAEDPELQPDFLVSAKEKKLAKDLIKKYVRDYFIDTSADKQLVKHLVYLEVMQARLQDQLNELHKRDAVVPIPQLEILQKNLESITKARQALGITKDKANAGRGDITKALELLKEKFAKYRENNQGSRTLKCPHCGEMILLKIRTSAWEAQKHPYFKDNLLTNPKLIGLYKAGKITKEDVASILDCSSDYIDWLLAKIENSNVGNQA